MNSNKMSELIRTSIEGIKTSFDANTVTGEPITTANGTVIIPVSKLTVGFATGGVDYIGKKAKEIGTDTNNFGGGGGTGISVVPVAFLIITTDGKVDLLSINDNSPADPITQIINAIERSPELIEKFKEVFKKKSE